VRLFCNKADLATDGGAERVPLCPWICDDRTCRCALRGSGSSMELIEDLKRHYHFRNFGTMVVGARLLTQVATTGPSLISGLACGRYAPSLPPLRHAPV